jgi:hypothetical protein
MQRGELLMQWCDDCQQFAGYPKIFCPHCYSSSLTWRVASGKGHVYTFSTVVSNPPSTFLDDLPYTIAIIDLPEGPRFLTRLVNVDPEAVYCGMPVRLQPHRVDDDIVMPFFEFDPAT